jgi:hypothetical protein
VYFFSSESRISFDCASLITDYIPADSRLHFMPIPEGKVYRDYNYVKEAVLLLSIEISRLIEMTKNGKTDLSETVKSIEQIKEIQDEIKLSQT